MPGDLRRLVETDLVTTLEGDYGLPVELRAPDGTLQTGLYGQILYDTIEENPETGERFVVTDPVVTLRRSSLTRVPKDGERWIVRIPLDAALDSPMESFVIDSDRPLARGRSIGFVRLYLRKVRQV